MQADARERADGCACGGVRAAPAERALSELLIAGELNALYSPPRPRRYHPVNGPIVRLFPDIRAIERQYFRATRMFAPQHLIAQRCEVWHRNRWIARALTYAFSGCTVERRGTQDCHLRFACVREYFPGRSPAGSVSV